VYVKKSGSKRLDDTPVTQKLLEKKNGLGRLDDTPVTQKLLGRNTTQNTEKGYFFEPRYRETV
jgi:hypothetical protein